jgi:hypothetical protein
MLVCKRNTLPLSSMNLQGITFRIVRGHASSPANKDETMQQAADNWKHVFR